MAILQSVPTILTLLIGIVGLWIVYRQLWIMQQQISLMQNQDELMTLQLSKRADLSLEIDSDILRQEDKSIRGCTLSFCICNKGNKSAKDHYWHILVPFDFSRLQTIDISISSVIQPVYKE